MSHSMISADQGIHEAIAAIVPVVATLTYQTPIEELLRYSNMLSDLSMHGQAAHWLAHRAMNHVEGIINDKFEAEFDDCWESVC